MATFTKTNDIVTFTNPTTGKQCTVARFVKDGTKRVFFTCEAEGVRFTKKMFPALYDAKRIARTYCNN